MRTMLETRRGSTGNIIAAIASFFIPGLGQLAQGRPFVAAFMLLVDFVLWIFLLGWLMHIWSTIDAAFYEG